MRTYYVKINGRDGIKMVAKNIDNMRKILIETYAKADITIFIWGKYGVGSHIGNLYVSKDGITWLNYKNGFSNTAKYHVYKNGKLGKRVW